MLHFFEPTAGQVLYHYTTVEGAEAILRTKTLRLSEFSMMNDKSEYSYARSKFLEAYQNREVRVEEVPRFMVNIKLNTHEPATVMMIGCMTEDPDDVGLWERYADGGKGCVLGIDALWLAECAGVKMRRVCYEAGNLRVFVNSGLMMRQSQYEENPEDGDELEQLATMLVLDLYAFKDPRFRSEMEIRISRLTITNSSAEYGLHDPGGHRGDGTEVPALLVQQRQGRHGPTRFVELPLWDEHQISAIKSVGFGPNADAQKEALVKRAASRIPQITFWRSDVPFR
jgi:hypothetical protein